MLYTIKNFLLDLLFPKFCVGCQKEGEWVCEICKRNILPVVTQVCPDCGQISELGRYCLDHKKRWGLSGIIVSAYYKEGPIKELIHNFKYNHILELKKILGGLMAAALQENLKENGSFFSGRVKMTPFLITAVPLHFLRKAQRGYNQSEILAEHIAVKFNLPKNFKIIRKIRRTKPQVKFSGKKRRENLQNSFKISRRTRFSVFGLNFPLIGQAQACSLKGKTIVIVDDVTTTGTTLNECARVLRAAGAQRVWGLVIAKG